MIGAPASAPTAVSETVPATPEAVARAVAALRAGRLVAFPTETVYGLGADADDPAAVAAIYRLKGRPQRHPVIVHVASVALLEGWIAAPPPAAERLMAAFWPGPLTLILAAGPRAHPGVTGGQATIGVRSPSHPVARDLLARFAGGVAAPSANRFGRISPTRAEHVAAEFAGVAGAPLILDGGASPVGLESTIVDLSGDAPSLLRPGAIGPAELEAVLGVALEAAASGAPRAPGRLARHYAPDTETVLVAPAELRGAIAREPGRVGVIAFGHDYPEAAMPVDLGADPDRAGRELYGAMRTLDGAGLDRILIETPPATPAWLAVADRVARAATPAPPTGSQAPREES